MNRFELNVHQSRFYQDRQFVLLVLVFIPVEKSLEAAQAFHQPPGRRRNKRSIPRPRAPDPVLCATKFSWRLVRSSPSPQQNRVDLPNQPK